jgi:hypothetical protein
MAVVVIAEVPGQTQKGFDHLIGTGLGDALRQAPGSILVTGFAVNGSWQTIEVWESTKEATQFFANVIQPNLPAGLKPKRTLHEVPTLVTKQGVMLASVVEKIKHT